jgi:hypothetical protein
MFDLPRLTKKIVERQFCSPSNNFPGRSSKVVAQITALAFLNASRTVSIRDEHTSGICTIKLNRVEIAIRVVAQQVPDGYAWSFSDAINQALQAWAASFPELNTGK